MREQNRKERGAAAVEFALVVPILILFLLGIIEYGNYFMNDMKASNAVMVGARSYAIGTEDWNAEAVTAAGSGWTAANFVRGADDCGGTFAPPAGQGALPSKSVGVYASKTYAGLFGDVIPHPSAIKARGVVRCER